MLASLAGVAILGGCASGGYGGPMSDNSLSPQEARLQAVETKTADLNRRVAGLEAVRSANSGDEIRAMRGDIEQLQHDLQIAQKQNQDALALMDQRLQRLEAATPNAAAAAGPSATGETPPSIPAESAPPQPATVEPNPPPAMAAVGAPAAAAAPTAADDATYKASLDLVKNGRYDDGIRSFRAMLDSNPQGPYADNAWYWMGEAYNAKGDAVTALQCFQTLQQRFPASPKVPDSLVATGRIQLQQGKTDLGKATLQSVIQKYPTSNAANAARTRLAQTN
jgi:tol-pal system protein YbgF